MPHIRVIHDPGGETLTVYFAEPRSNQVCEETGEGVILIKDRQGGEVIGFERLYYNAQIPSRWKHCWERPHDANRRNTGERSKRSRGGSEMYPPRVV